MITLIDAEFPNASHDVSFSAGSLRAGTTGMVGTHRTVAQGPVSPAATGMPGPDRFAPTTVSNAVGLCEAFDAVAR